MWHRVCRTKSVGMRRVACGCAVCKLHSAPCLWTCSKPGLSLDCFARSSRVTARTATSKHPVLKRAMSRERQPMRHMGARRGPNPSPPPLGGLFEGLILTTKPDMLRRQPTGLPRSSCNEQLARCDWAEAWTCRRRFQAPPSDVSQKEEAWAQRGAVFRVSQSQSQCRRRTAISCAHEAPGEQ